MLYSYCMETCIIFGASGGIGTALCERLVDQFRLVLCGRKMETLEPLGHRFGGLPLPCDARSFSQVDEVFRRASEGGNKVVGAVNLAGSILLKPAHLTTESDFQETVELNLKSAFAVVRGAARAMMPEGGSVVLMSSVAAQVGLANHEAIAAAKGGVSALTRSCAATYAGRGVRFNAVAPGLVETPMSERLTANPKSLEVSRNLHPLGRIGAPEEVASLIAWLLSPANSWMTGQVIGLDGGLATVRGR